MKTGYTHITVALDCSASMQSICTDAIGGFNQFLKDQQALPGEATGGAVSALYPQSQMKTLTVTLVPRLAEPRAVVGAACGVAVPTLPRRSR